MALCGYMDSFALREGQINKAMYHLYNIYATFQCCSVYEHYQATEADRLGINNSKNPITYNQLNDENVMYLSGPRGAGLDLPLPFFNSRGEMVLKGVGCKSPAFYIGNCNYSSIIYMSKKQFR